MRRLLLVSTVTLLLSSGAVGSTRTIDSLVADLDRFTPLVGATDPELVQARYDAARSLEEALSAGTSPPACRPLANALTRATRMHILASEAIDRRSPTLRQRAEASVRTALNAVWTSRSACPTGSILQPIQTTSESLLEPLSREAFFGRVRARIPPGARSFDLLWRGSAIAERQPARGSILSLDLPAGLTGKGTLVVRFRDEQRRILRSPRAEAVWLLPTTAARTPAGARRSIELERRLAVIAQGFAGYSGLYIHDLGTGRSAGWNEDARFPAASTVKLGVLAAALDRYGPRPEATGPFYDMVTLAAWSSNLGANRLLRLLGGGDSARGRTVVEDRLRRMGATRSTYPGDYRVGTSTRAAPHEPPLVSQRTTTARDLAQVLATIHAAATGRSSAVRASGLSRHEARVALALLLDSRPSGDNTGLFRPWIRPTTPLAQKHGWISTARHSAAIVYTSRGPVIAVCLTYDDELSLRRATALGRLLLDAAGVIA